MVSLAAEGSTAGRSRPPRSAARGGRVTPYARGRAFEYRVRSQLEEQGYSVFRTAGSRSPVDPLAFREGTVLFVQCKSGQRGISRRERMALVDLATGCGAIAAVARRGGIVEVLA